MIMDRAATMAVSLVEDCVVGFDEMEHCLAGVKERNHHHLSAVCGEGGKRKKTFPNIFKISVCLCVFAIITTPPIGKPLSNDDHHGIY